VLDNGSLQNGNFPAFLPDGTGGGVFSWYDVSTPTLQCSAQHINSDGTEAFAHNGVTVSTNTMRIRVDPWAAHDPVSHNTYVFWEEENSLQSQFGLYGQKLDATGGRLWGSSGIAFVALSNVAVLWTRTVLSGNGAYVFWSGEPSFNQDRVYGMHVDGNGNVDVPQFDVASTPSGKQRFNVASSTAGYAILDWADARTDGGDIYAQDIPLGAPTAVPEIGRSATTLALQARPNPSAGAVFVEYAAPVSAATNLDVLDVAGRLVRHLQTGTAASGSATWDGRDDSGRDVSAGVYFVRLKAGAAMDSRRVTLIR